MSEASANRAPRTPFVPIVPIRSNVDLMNILQVRIPGELVELDRLLASPVYAVSLARPRRATRQLNTVASNLRRVGASSSGTAEAPVIHIPVNESVALLLNELEEKFVTIRKHARDLEHWLTLTTPMLETGCDLRVEVKRIAAAMVRRIQNENSNRHQAIADYHLTRSALLQKFIENPGFCDNLLSVEKFDMGQMELFKAYAVQMKNSYEEMLHFFQVNINYIK